VPTAWCWTFGDGAYAGVANGSHTYVLRGIYNVSSNVSNSAGYNISYNIERVI
jgi:PKD repeat protein